MPMDSAELKALLEAAKADALAGTTASKLADERTDALDYYLGDMTDDMPFLPDRSSAVSTDVADTIEGLMPALIEIFTAGEEPVQFEPVGVEDEEAARQETDYVNWVFMQQNKGFLVLYDFIKDALLSKVGIVKIYWEEKEEEEKHTYMNVGEDVLALLKMDKSLIVEAVPVEDQGYAA